MSFFRNFACPTYQALIPSGCSLRSPARCCFRVVNYFSLNMSLARSRRSRAVAERKRHETGTHVRPAGDSCCKPVELNKEEGREGWIVCVCRFFVFQFQESGFSCTLECFFLFSVFCFRLLVLSVWTGKRQALRGKTKKHETLHAACDGLLPTFVEYKE